MDKGKAFWYGINNIKIVADIINDKRKNKMAISANVYKAKNVIDLHYGMKSSEAVENILGILKDRKLAPLFRECIEDMFTLSFSKSSSIEGGIVVPKVSFGEKDLLTKINLLEHTLGVVSNMANIIDDSFNRMFDYFLLAALVHDFGKSPRLRKIYGLDGNQHHHQKSANYLAIKINSLELNIGKYEMELLEMTVTAIRTHHDKVVENDETKKKRNEIVFLILEKLKEADTLQRAKEIAKLDVRTKIATSYDETRV